VNRLRNATLLAATLCTGLMAGLFAAFAYSVMPGLARSSDRTTVEAMQRINEAIMNPVFMLLFMGAIPLLGAAVVLVRREPGRPALAWLVAALACYLVAFMVTSGANVPLNDQLAQAGAPGHVTHLAAVRDDFESPWVAWNVVRAVLHTASFACMAWALLLVGARRPERTGDRATLAPSPVTSLPGQDVFVCHSPTTLPSVSVK
jgi:uncharacterized membrane protein